MLKRTPIIGVVLGGAIAVVVALFLEQPGRPFSAGQYVLLYLVSFLPGMGIAMLFDPFPRRKKTEYLEIDFYAEKS